MRSCGSLSRFGSPVTTPQSWLMLGDNQLSHTKNQVVENRVIFKNRRLESLRSKLKIIESKNIYWKCLLGYLFNPRAFIIEIIS